MNTTPFQLADIANTALTQALQHKLDNKTKPLGSLGRLEDVALKIGQILGSTAPVLEQPQMVVFAGDHGLTARGISAFPSDVTWQMVENFLAGGAAVSVLARQNDISLTVVDCGVRHEFAPRAGLLVRKVAPGTADALEGPAMSAAQCAQALANGREVLRSLPPHGLHAMCAVEQLIAAGIPVNVTLLFSTAHYLADRLANAGVSVTMLARGVPVGSELEYVDLGTIAHALVDRRST